MVLVNYSLFCLNNNSNLHYICSQNSYTIQATRGVESTSVTTVLRRRLPESRAKLQDEISKKIQAAKSV